MNIFKTSFASSIKSRLRSRLFWVCVVINFLPELYFELTTDWEELLSAPGHALNLHEQINEWAGASAGSLGVMWLFISVVAGVDILKSGRDRFADIETASPSGKLSIFAGKILSYYLLGLILWFGLSFLRMGSYYAHAAGKVEQVYGFGEALWMTVQRCFVMAVPLIALYLSTAVFVAVFMKSSVAGILASIILNFTVHIPGFIIKTNWKSFDFFNIYTFFGKYVYQPSIGITFYWNFHGIRNKQEEFGWMREYPNAFENFFRSELITLLIAASLLILAYFKYKRIRDN